MKLQQVKEKTSENIYDNIKEAITIKDVLSKLPDLNLTEQGNRLVGNCPTGHPSTSETCFSIDTEKNLCHCFSCNSGGSVIDLVSLVLNLDISDAVRWIAREFKLSVNIDTGALKDFNLSDKFKSNEINSRIKHQLFEELVQYGREKLYSEEGKPVLSYLSDERGYETDKIKNTEFFFFPPQAEIRKHLKSKFPELTKEVDTISLNGFLKDEVRLAFPYRNRMGVITGIIKRVANKTGIKKITKKGEEKWIRYDSSYGTKKPDLFGLDKIKIKEDEPLLILEGYPDAIYFSALGFKNVVALGQGLFSQRHIQGLLSKKVKNVVLALDNDQVGPTNTIRAIELLLKMSEINVYVLDQCKLDPHKDPDEYVKANGMEKFKKLVEDAKSGELWRLENLATKYDLTKDIKKNSALDEAMIFSMLIKSEVNKSEYLKKVCDLFDKQKAEVNAEFKRLRSQNKLDKYNNEKKSFSDRTKEKLFPFIEKSSSSYAYYERSDDDIKMGISSDILGEILLSEGQKIPETFPVLKTVFNPLSDAKFNFEDNTINLFSPTDYMLMSRTMKEIVLEDDCQKIFRVLSNLIPKKDERERFVNWLAGIMQTREKQLTAWVFKGEQGTGKNLLREFILQPIFGYRQVIQVEDGLLKSEFNSYLKNALIIAFNEVANENNSSRNSMKSKIKAIITDKEIWINEKHVKNYPIDNFANCLFFSNESVPVVIEGGDRRFNVVRTGKPLRDYDWFNKNPEGFIGGLSSELDNFAQYLINYDYDPILAKTVIENEEKQSLVEAAMNRFEEFAKKLKEQDVDWLNENQQTNPSSLTESITPVIGRDLRGMILKDTAVEVFNKIYPNHKTNKITLTNQMKLYGIEIARENDLFGKRKQFYKW